MIQTKWLEQGEYSSILKLQYESVETVRQNGIDIILATEHQPCITLGRRCESSLPTRFRDIPHYHVKRGGLATYHGPGQLTVYPIIQLARFKLGIKRWVNIIERIIQKSLRDQEILSHTRKNYPGVYTENGKIASIGLHVVDGISMHGFSIMVHNELVGFQTIEPCGVANQAISSIEQELGFRIDMPSFALMVLENTKNTLQNLTKTDQ